MNTTTRRAGTAAGLALAAVAVTLPAALAAVTGHNEQVVLIDGTDEQLEFSSDVSGAGQVISADGRYVVFSTAASLVAADDNELDDVYRRDTVAGSTVLVSQRNGNPGNDYSFEPTISADGSRSPTPRGRPT